MGAHSTCYVERIKGVHAQYAIIGAFAPLVDDSNQQSNKGYTNPRPVNQETSRISAANATKQTQNFEQPTKPLQLPAVSFSFSVNSELVRLCDKQLLEINRKVVQSTDPNEIEELCRAAKQLRRFRKNELSAERLRLRHLFDKPHRQRKKPDVDKGAEPPDPAKLTAFIKELIGRNPARARSISRRMGLDLDAALPILYRLVSEPKRTPLDEFGGQIFSEFLKTLSTQPETNQSGSSNPQRTDTQRSTSSQEQERLNIAGRTFDLTKPYPCR